MDKSKKIYIKSLDKYNNGYIDKALELCEESISIDIKNSAAINFKGLLYYLKGDLDNAQRLWKMNYEINKDGVSEKYLNDTKKDKERLKLYKSALDFINELKVNEALKLLKKCSESDYNFICVNNYLALCYIKKGQYDKAIVHIDNVLKIDRNNEMSKRNKKNLEEFGVIKKNINIKKLIYASSLIIFIILCIVIGKNFIKNIKGSYAYTENKIKSLTSFYSKLDNIKGNISKKSNEDYRTKQKYNNTAINKTKIKSESEAFPEDRLNNDIQNQNFEDIYEIHTMWKDKNIDINSKITLSKADELLKNQGVKYFYDKGYEFLNNKDYQNAKQYLLKAYDIGEQSYLYSHIIYMLGSSFYLSGDVENAIKYYTKYNENFPDGAYEDTVLYNLATIYKDIDKSKAQNYADELVKKYPSSIYNNSIVKNLISNQ